MTEDPVKLYVVVMALLVLVLGWVAHTSYRDAAAFEAAIERAPAQAAKMREIASEVKGLVQQLSGSQLQAAEGGFASVIENAANAIGVSYSNLKSDERSIGSKGKERTWKFEVRRSGSGVPLTRDQVARLCRKVESDSGFILKTIEIALRRNTGNDGIPPGKTEKVLNDTYTGYITFGLRVVDG